MIKALVFDFDGVLFDSNAMKEELFVTVFGLQDEKGANLIRFWSSSIGPVSRYQKIPLLYDALLKEKVIDGSLLVSDYISAYNEGVRDRFFSASARPEVFSLLENLKDDYALFVSSATPDDSLNETVSALGLGSLFDRVLGSTSGTKADNLFFLMEEYSFQANELVMIGDGETDERGAFDAGVPFVAIANQWNSFSERTDLPFVIDDVVLVEEILKKM